MDEILAGGSTKVICKMIDENPYLCKERYFKKYSGSTLLEMACKEGNLEAMKVLLKHSDINGDQWDSPLLVATPLGNISVVTFLVENGAKIDLRGS
jgi:ankyrin repeat protein